jgi:hypothetical protein
VTNTLKLLLATIVGTTLTIGSLSATEHIEKIDAFKNITTQSVSVKESNLLAGKLTRREFLQKRNTFCESNPESESCIKVLGLFYAEDLYRR